MTQALTGLCVLLVAFVLPSVFSLGFDGIPGRYCSTRPQPYCCPGRRHELFPTRDDDCTAPILENHKCYCDAFCDRTADGGDKDCCPDYDEVCRGVTPEPITKGACKDQSGNEWGPGERVQMNCWTCQCTANGWSQCEPNTINANDPDSTCMIQPKLLTQNRNGRFSWTARNYTQFWGKTLSDGLTYRLGTLYPEDVVRLMSHIKPENIEQRIPENFDARQEWPGKISGVLDQGNCGSSWAFSTVSVAADRNAIMGQEAAVSLSPQQLLSCNQDRQRGCKGGYLDRAWWYLRKYGVVNEQCYPYQSGRSNQQGSCQISVTAYKALRPGGELTCPSAGGASGKVHKITPPYRIKSDEREIQHEIMNNGPVQATFRVFEDFFMYENGVYEKMPGVREDPNPDRNGYHSVKILGWGVDTTNGAPVNYWLAQNSWGESWGDRGLFKIKRGENHCEIEAFVIGAVGYRAKKKKRMLRKMRRRKLLL